MSILSVFYKYHTGEYWNLHIYFLSIAVFVTGCEEMAPGKKDYWETQAGKRVLKKQAKDRAKEEERQRKEGNKMLRAQGLFRSKGGEVQSYAEAGSSGGGGARNGQKGAWGGQAAWDSLSEDEKAARRQAGHLGKEQGILGAEFGHLAADKGFRGAAGGSKAYHDASVEEQTRRRTEGGRGGWELQTGKARVDIVNAGIDGGKRAAASATEEEVEDMRQEGTETWDIAPSPVKRSRIEAGREGGTAAFHAATEEQLEEQRQAGQHYSQEATAEEVEQQREYGRHAYDDFTEAEMRSIRNEQQFARDRSLAVRKAAAAESYQTEGAPAIVPDHSVWGCNGFLPGPLLPDQEQQPCEMTCADQTRLLSFVNISDLSLLYWLVKNAMGR